MNKYIKIESVNGYDDTYTIINIGSNNPIGYIAIYPATKEVCMATPIADNTIWNTQCLEDILNFIETNFKINKRKTNNFTGFINNHKLIFTEVQTKRKTKVFDISSYKGEIKYQTGWRQYCLFTKGERILYPDQIKQITDFIKNLNEERKK